MSGICCIVSMTSCVLHNDIREIACGVSGVVVGILGRPIVFSYLSHTLIHAVVVGGQLGDCQTVGFGAAQLTHDSRVQGVE